MASITLKTMPITFNLKDHHIKSNFTTTFLCIKLITYVLHRSLHGKDLPLLLLQQVHHLVEVFGWLKWHIKD